MIENLFSFSSTDSDQLQKVSRIKVDTHEELMVDEEREGGREGGREGRGGTESTGRFWSNSPSYFGGRVINVH